MRRWAVAACWCAATAAAASLRARVELPPSPHPLLRLGAAELSRYLADMGVTTRTERAAVYEGGARVRGGVSGADNDNNADLVIYLDVAPPQPAEGSSIGGTAADGGGSAARPFYVLSSGSPSISRATRGGVTLSVVGSDAQHGVYGVYALLSRCGMTFGLAGATLPPRPPDVARLAAELAATPVRDTPAFTTRGLQPFHDFSEGEGAGRRAVFVVAHARSLLHLNTSTPPHPSLATTLHPRHRAGPPTGTSTVSCIDSYAKAAR